MRPRVASSKTRAGRPSRALLPCSTTVCGPRTVRRPCGTPSGEGAYRLVHEIHSCASFRDKGLNCSDFCPEAIVKRIIHNKLVKQTKRRPPCRWTPAHWQATRNLCEYISGSFFEPLPFQHLPGLLCQADRASSPACFDATRLYPHSPHQRLGHCPRRTIASTFCASVA